MNRNAKLIAFFSDSPRSRPSSKPNDNHIFHIDEVLFLKFCQSCAHFKRNVFVVKANDYQVTWLCAVVVSASVLSFLSPLCRVRAIMVQSEATRINPSAQ